MPNAPSPPPPQAPRAARLRRLKRPGRLALVVAAHAGVFWLLLQPLPMPNPAPDAAAIALRDIPAPAPPVAPEDAGESAPPAPVAEPIAISVPPPEIVIERPAPAMPPVAARGPDTAAGRSTLDAGGSAAGGSGAGLGSGTGGAGRGGGGTPPRRIRGDITRRDFPRIPADALVASSVTVRLQVSADGRVQACDVLRSSGNPQRDAITCRLARQRFRYAPARAPDGTAVDGVAGWRQDWFPR